MVGKTEVETELAIVGGRVSKSIGRMYYKIICCKNRARCGTTAYYSLGNNVDHGFSESLTLHPLSYV